MLENSFQSYLWYGELDKVAYLMIKQRFFPIN